MLAGLAAEGEDRMVEVPNPQGFRFAPVDEELVEFYLLPKLQGKATVPNDAIIEANVYEFQPDKLIDLYRDRGEDAWYFLSPRARIYQKGSRPSRKTEDGVGRWKASTATKVLMAYETVPDGVRFCANVLNYFVGTDTKHEQRSKWLMRELTIPNYKIKCDENGGDNGRLDQYVMCKIYPSPVNKEGDDKSAESELSGRRAGKRKRSGGQGSLTIGGAQASSSGTVSAPAQATGSSNSQLSIPMQQFSPYAAGVHPNSSGQMTTMARPPNMGFAAPGTSFRPQVSLNCHYDHNYMALHSPANAAYRMPQHKALTFAPPWQKRAMTFAPPPSQSQQLQRPYLNGNSNDHAGPIAPQWPPYNSDPYEGSSTAQAAGDKGGATAPYSGSGIRMGSGDLNVGNQFVELASINSIFAGARPPTFEPPQTEPGTPIRPPEAETETDEASSLHKQDTLSLYFRTIEQEHCSYYCLA